MNPRWSRDNRILAAVFLGLGAALAGLYALFLRTRALTPAAATNRVVLFVLFYIVVVLILVLVFVLVRNGVNLLLDARRGVFGSRFRVRIVATNVGLALLPIVLLLLPTTGLLQRSVEQWFAPAVEETIRSGRDVVEILRKRSAGLEERTAERLAPGLAASRADADVVALLAAAREGSGVDLIEWRSAAAPPGTPALAVSAPRWPIRDVKEPDAAWLSDARARGSARRVEETAGGARTGRTIVALPGGLLLVGTYEPPEEAVAVRRLSEATSAYAMLSAERASLAAIQVLLFLLLSLLVLLASVWVGLVLARRVTRPIAALASSARRVGAGDFDARVEVEGGDEIAALSGAFNAMTTELGESRGQLVRANEELSASNRRLDGERRRVATILAHLEAGVLAFAEDGMLLAINETAQRLLESPGAVEGQRLESLLDAPHLAPLGRFLTRARGDRGPREATFTLSGRVVDARVAKVPARPDEPASWVVTLEDTTALVRAERAAAWEEAARKMAHEIKNPLTPIRLAAERMRRRAVTLPAENPGGAELKAVVEEGASTIVEEVGTLSGLVDSFGRFARLPAATLAPTDLAVVVAQVVKLYGDLKAGVTLTADVPDGLPEVRADAEQVKRALVNLVDNAVSATPPGGCVRIGARVVKGRAELSVSDDGPGIPPENREHVFDPTFSTKERGSGLGLAITARIAAEHSGRVRVEENLPRGCRFVLEWPAA